MSDPQMPRIMPLKIICDDPKCPWRCRLVHAKTGEVIPFTYLKWEVSAQEMPRIEVHISGPNISAELAAELVVAKLEDMPCSSPKET